MATIRILPETVQNKIAAGEVIERPASVVKELAENAMDAGARLVAIDLEEGGHRLIRVADDGAGMDEADLIASLHRHATSKIRDVDDIFAISTFGFRGEALPSIASVSRMTVATCARGAEEGREILVEGGRTVRLSPAPPRVGTTVEVRDIFFNTPARRKFLRQPGSENARAGEIVTRLALGNPGIGFRLQTGGRMTLSVKPAETQLERIGEIFGRELADKLVPFSKEVTDGLSVSGFFARPPKSCRNTRDIYVLVNRRWIRFFGLARAVGDAFQGILPPREYPFAVINLAVDPARVDLNVHPAKEEVRFEREDLVIGAVKVAIREALAGISAMPTVTGAFGPPPRRAEPAAPWRPAAPPPFFAAGPGGGGGMPENLSATRDALRRDDRRSDLPPREPAGGAAPASAETASEPASPPPDDGAPRNTGKLMTEGGYRLLNQTGGKYIILDSPDGVVFIDPHALHERWNFDRLVEEGKRGVATERLLLPIELRLAPMEAATAEDTLPVLAEHGFECLLPEADLLRVTAAPSYIPPSKVENLIRQILADVGDADAAVGAVRERVLASLACRSSVLLGRTLPEEEMAVLLDRFINQGQFPTCPHGRPTAVKVSWSELERWFGR